MDDQRAIAAYHEQKKLKARRIEISQATELLEANHASAKNTICQKYKGVHRLERLRKERSSHESKMRNLRDEDRRCRRKLLEIKELAIAGSMYMNKKAMKAANDALSSEDNQERIDYGVELREIKELLKQVLEKI